MTIEKKKRILPLWNSGKNGYIIVVSRIGNDKVFSESELSWSDITANSTALDEVMEGLRECCAMIQQSHETAIKAIESQINEQENAKLPVLPKTPNPPKRTIMKRRTKKVSTASIVRRSTRATASVASRLIQESLLGASDKSQSIEPLVKKRSSGSDGFRSSGDRPIRFRLSSSSDSFSEAAEIPIAPVSQQAFPERTSKESETDGKEPICNDQASSVSTTILKKVSCSPEIDKETDSKFAESTVKSISPTVLPQQLIVPKKAAIKRKAKQSTARSKSKRVTRHTRQSAADKNLNKTQLSSDNDQSCEEEAAQERHDVAIQRERPNAKQSQDEGNSPSKMQSSCNLPTVEEAVEEPNIKESEPIPSAPSSGARLSVSLRRLSDKDIKQYISPPKSSDVQANQISESIHNENEIDMNSNSGKSFSLTLSGNSDDEETLEKLPLIVKSVRESAARKRKSALVLDGLAAKRRSTRNKAFARKSLAKAQASSLKVAARNAESTSPNSTSSTEEPPAKMTKSRPRIVKPLIRNKTAKPKTFLGSAKGKNRHHNSLAMSATPVRTRSKLTTPLFRTPTLSNINTTVKSFLARNTPEPINKEAIIEAKKKLLEEKQRQGEERQRLIEEKKKKKLAESKKKREERARHAVRVRKIREREERERQDHIQGKWEQRIADANRTKSQRKLETTAKVNREMAKIAKAEARRKEEEEEKLRKFKEQEEEKEKRLHQQQLEKKLAEEQRLKEKLLEEQKRIEEEKLREERLKQEEEERQRKAEAAALKKKQEEEARKKKQQEKLQSKRKKAEIEREAARKQKLEEKRLAKEQEEKRKAQEKQEKEEKLRREKEQMEAAKERILKVRQADMEKERLIILEKEKAAKKLETAKKKELLRQRLEENRRLQLEKLKQEEEKAKAQARQLEYQKKLKEAEVRINQLVTHPSQQSHTHTPNTTFLQPDLNKTYMKDESSVNYDMTPRGPGKPLIPSTADNYNLDDFCSDDSTDDEDRPKKTVPKWAKGALLHSAIVGQHSHPPDLDKIFPKLLDPVQLSHIFKKPKTRYYQRTSSAQWNSPIMPPGHISFTDQCKGF